ncbi:TMEM165/GDT1 family protein [Crocosphaera sp.]|uniref:TMEM165/GDT1 family protein n=1 Tax=Crocosphaera sp. TaxID=2729996 RepID=UPI003F22E639|nr:TMEM165/GDT1 family protein [Crocosphaera sp.]
MTASETKETEEQDNSSPDSKSNNEKSWSFWTVFSSTFLTIFLAEMGDKTQLATLLISAQSQSPWVVFAGAAVALIATSLLGVLIGYWLARRLSPKTLDIAVALLLLIITGLLVGDVLNS